jgi:hypothetical protein
MTDRKEIHQELLERFDNLESKLAQKLDVAREAKVYYLHSSLPLVRIRTQPLNIAYDDSFEIDRINMLLEELMQLDWNNDREGVRTD